MRFVISQSGHMPWLILHIFYIKEVVNNDPQLADNSQYHLNKLLKTVISLSLLTASGVIFIDLW